MPSDYFLVTSSGRDTTTATEQTNPTDLLIYLLPGNPGVIVYYRDFINELNTLLSKSLPNINYTLAGRSLAGFELDDIEVQKDSLLLPFDLKQQVENVHARIRTAVANAQGLDKGATAVKPEKKLPVILVGHSVGAYMLLEIIAQRQRTQGEGGSVNDAESRYEIIGGINLFPTVVDLAKSPRGKMVAPLFYIPFFATWVHFLAGILWLFIPEPWINWLVRKINGMPYDAARTTTALLGARTGVEASLHLAKHELADMTEDKWNEQLWQATENAKTDHPSLYFYWAENDHWIDNETRDKLIASRARQLDKAASDPKEKAKPKMEIDSKGIPHDFVLRHNKPVAEKVAEYIDEIVKERM